MRRSWFALSISVISFLLHLLWEYIQCSALFIHLKLTPKFLSMIRVSLGDVAILWVSYLFVSGIKKTFFWGLTPWNSSGGIIFLLISAGIAELLEYKAIQQGLWTYTSANPRLPVLGISIVPIFQMMVVNSVSLSLARFFIKNHKPINGRRMVMKKKGRIFFFVLFLIGTLPLGNGCAKDNGKFERPNKQRNFESRTTGEDANQMMMENMSNMMNECMEMHQDSKMCNHQTMEKCQENMNEAECEKMMDQMHSKDK